MCLDPDYTPGGRAKEEILPWVNDPGVSRDFYGGNGRGPRRHRTPNCRKPAKDAESAAEVLGL
jgi:hypothetical protein